MQKHKKRLCQDDKVNSLHNLRYNIAHNISQIHTSFEMSCYQAWWFNKDNTCTRSGVARVLAGRSARLADTLQIPSLCLQIRSGVHCTHLHPLAYRPDLQARKDVGLIN